MSSNWHNIYCTLSDASCEVIINNGLCITKVKDENEGELVTLESKENFKYVKAGEKHIVALTG